MQKALAGKDPMFMIGSVIAGSPARKEAQKLMNEFLRDEYRRNPEQFYSEWVRFDLVDEEAVQNVWELLFWYCHWNGAAYVTGMHDVTRGRLLGFSDPKVFTITHFVKPRNWWHKYWYGFSERDVSFTIVTKNTYRLVGELKDFELFSKDFYLHCTSKEFTIRPPNSP